MAHLYLITWHTYGSWLHGDDRGSVAPGLNRPGGSFLPPQRGLFLADARRLTSTPVTLDERQRDSVVSTIHEVSAHHGWLLHAAHARTTHVHVVVTAPAPPERVMNALKSWATRNLRERSHLDAGARVWSRHGSTRWIDSDTSLLSAVRYVVHAQGAPMACFVADAHARLLGTATAEPCW